MTVSDDGTVATPGETGPDRGFIDTGKPECDQLVSGDLLVEDVSIDGMCGVY